MPCRPQLAVPALASAPVVGRGTTESADRQAGAVEAAAPSTPVDYGYVRGLSGIGGGLITGCAIACVAG